MRCNAGIDEASDGKIQLLSMFQVQTAVLWRRRRMRCHRARSVYICKRANERARDAVDQPQRLEYFIFLFIHILSFNYNVYIIYMLSRQVQVLYISYARVAVYACIHHSLY